jgi:hypothetical protein
VEIKQQIGAFLRDELKLEMSAEKTLITHARNEKAKFLGYEIHAFHADDRRGPSGIRSINGGIGLRVPRHVVQEHCSKYMRCGKALHKADRVNRSAMDIVARYQAEYRGVVQYYRQAYNLHTMSRLRRTMELSLVKTLARKFKTRSQTIYRRFRATTDTPDGTYTVLQVVTKREPGRPPREAHFGGVSLKWDPRAEIREEKRTGGGSREILTRMLRRKCELCGQRNIDVQMHHIRKLADLDRFDPARRPRWARLMAARRRKSLAVCAECHSGIHDDLAASATRT